ncbi:hypothetical protein PUN28_000990 [Cardiocondyla obscurior]|uniref:Uncharacterized protein n=1 Tax=Cardiocondyla obscurior TaxID=286306 RepID=A0AAW2H2T9_9HYME
MLVYVLSVFSFLILGLSSAEEVDLSLKTCDSKSYNFSACVKDNLESVLPQLIKGIPQYDVPPIDPFFLEYQKIAFNSNNIHGEIIFVNLSVTGLAKVKFLDVTPQFLDDEIFKIEIDSHVPELDMKTIVKINSSLNVFKILSESPVHVVANDIRGKADFIGHVINDTWVLDHIRIYPTIEKFKISANNLIEDNKELSKY